jgi:DNA-binding GntR family transcriptional regulator
MRKVAVGAICWPPAVNNDAHLTRAGAVSIRIAERLLASRVGERLPRIADYAGEFGTGVGTVQRALQILEESGAI